MRVHLIGIAGNGMRALAEVLHAWQWRVSGSDLGLEEVKRLADCGIRLFAGHASDHLSADTQLVVHSDAIPPDNPELGRAKELGIRRISYFQMLGELTTGSPLIAAAGTHGKSTTAAMLGWILSDAGMDPTVVCGAALPGRTSGGRAGGRQLFVAEACEYRRNFLHLRPQQAAILGIEPDHFDCYPAKADLESAFAQFARQIPPDGYLLFRHDCVASQKAARQAAGRIESFGLSPDADWSAEIQSQNATGQRFTIIYRNRPQFEVHLPLPGRYQVLNALAAAVLGLQNGVAPQGVSESLRRFPGLKRRFEIVAAANGVTWIDDYAHHPTEVQAAIETARQVFPNRRLYCVFQPHRVLRTERLLDEFAQSLHNADIVLIAEIYRAREGPPQAGEISAADLARCVLEIAANADLRGRKNVKCGMRNAECGERAAPPTAHCPLPTLPSSTNCTVPSIHDFPEIKKYLRSQLQSGDIVLTLGAGDIRKVFDGFFAGI